MSKEEMEKAAAHALVIRKGIYSLVKKGFSKAVEAGSKVYQSVMEEGQKALDAEEKSKDKNKENDGEE